MPSSPLTLDAWYAARLSQPASPVAAAAGLSPVCPVFDPNRPFRVDVPEGIGAAEAAFAGLLRGARTELAACIGSPLQVPARAEIVLEGSIRPDPDASASLANARVHGKPLTVSEYDHPNTNFYSAEGNLILTANAAFQDWAGFYQFAWTHSRAYVRDAIPPTFDMCSANAKLAHLPACYAMFVRGDVQAGPVTTAYALPSRLSGEVTAVARAKNARAVGRPENEDDMGLALAVFSGQHIAENGPLQMPAATGRGGGSR